MRWEPPRPLLPLSRPPLARAALTLLVLLPAAAFAQFPQGLLDALTEAVELYRQSRAEVLRVATDPNERREVLAGPALFQRHEPAEVFVFGDEAFEAELDRGAGLGRGEGWGPPPNPARGRRIHDGERGGLDASSCRSCHFVGGPDGSGRLSQVAALRGDGQRLSTATLRDPPHVMGLGYLVRVARETEAALRRRTQIAQEQARAGGEPVRTHLTVGERDFGFITAFPDGTMSTDALRGISTDLRVRPLGHKGRHADLVSLADEALQVHLGIQTDSRIATYGEESGVWLGEGTRFDPDSDGVQAEATGSQAVLLGAYLSMLPVPQIRPPDDPRLAFVWSRGYAAFTEVGCAACHVPALRVRDMNTVLTATDATVEYRLDLAREGQAPRPQRVDFGADEMNAVPGGTPIYAFTDLQRHDMGPALADAEDERLPDGSGTVPASVWLTRPLWGLADTGPYLHDGRASTVEEAIMAHGGEAVPSRDAYTALDDMGRAALRVFLASLTRDPVILVE